MDTLTGNFYSTIHYNDVDLKTNSLNLAVTDGPGTDNVKFNLDVSTSGMNTEGIKIFGKGDTITFTINISNFNDIPLTKIKAPVSGWNSSYGLPVVLTLPDGLRLNNYDNSSVPEGSQSDYVIYTENGVSTKMTRVIAYANYDTDTYSYRVLDNEYTFLLPGISANTSAYITFIAEATSTVSAGDVLEASSTINFTENNTGAPIASNNVSVKYSYSDLSAEKKAPACVYYDQEFTYEIVMENSGDLTANIDNISDLVPDMFTISRDENSKYKVSVKRDENALIQDEDFSVTLQSKTLTISPYTANKLDIASGSKLTVEVTGKISKSA